MASPDIAAVVVKTAPAPTDDSDITGYEVLKTAAGYTAPLILQTTPDPNVAGDRASLVGSVRQFPPAVQATIEPYFERACLPHQLTPGSAIPVPETEVRLTVEIPGGDLYHVQKFPNGTYYASCNGHSVTPPRGVVDTVQSVFPNYDP